MGGFDKRNRRPGNNRRVVHPAGGRAGGSGLLHDRVRVAERAAGHEAGKGLGPNARPARGQGWHDSGGRPGMTPLILSFCVLSILLCALISTDRKAAEGETDAGADDPVAKNHLGLQPGRNS